MRNYTVIVERCQDTGLYVVLSLHFFAILMTGVLQCHFMRGAMCHPFCFDKLQKMWSCKFSCDPNCRVCRRGENNFIKSMSWMWLTL